MLSESITSKVLEFSYYLYCSETALARCFHVLIPIKMLVLKWTPRGLLTFTFTFTRLYPKIIDMTPSLAPPPPLPQKKRKKGWKKKLIMTAKRKSNRSFVALFAFSSLPRRHFSPRGEGTRDTPLRIYVCGGGYSLSPSNSQTPSPICAYGTSTLLSQRHQYQLPCACLVYMQNYKRVQSLVCHRTRYNAFSVSW